MGGFRMMRTPRPMVRHGRSCSLRRRTQVSAAKPASRLRQLLLTGALLTPWLVASHPALAQAVQGDEGAGTKDQQDQKETASIEEIVVTATKRGAQRIQEVPMSIQAVTSEQIAETGALEFSDLAGLVPSLQIQDLGPGDKEYIIRGVNSSAVATVGVYYDEAVITARNKQ
ncbi:MAG: hypothetical protein D6740_07615, partial [Alphaproteobacteria bacterium]